ncbi:MAG TPA: hypothetical protein VM032_11620 [Vicinamibacterales bacterium]|nr:hypothetical protein [Vicinamibacterales bacterium]
MKTKTLAGGLCAAALTLGATALVNGQQPAPAARTTADQSMTITGCVMSEADYRKAHDAGKGGVVGTGVGVGNEFILAEAGPAPAPGSSAARDAQPTGTSGTTASGAMTYELTGSNEGQASRFVGRRVEVMGHVKGADVSAAGTPTGGPTAGRPPAGVDVASKDLQLPEFEVASIREVPGSCSTQK